MKSRKLAGLAAALLLSAGAARADVEISSKATSNMSCDAGVCTATAQKAVLNVGDLATMLASGDVAVKTGNIAKDIDIDQPLTWASTSRLTLDAQRSVTVKKQVTVSAQGALTVTTNDGGKQGEFIIVPEHGSVQFWDLGSSLIIDGNSYTLVRDIKTLAADIAANPSGFYGLAKPYDASADGVYSASPVSATFTGTFEGLGNAISNFTLNFRPGVVVQFGMFADAGDAATIRNFGITDATVSGFGQVIAGSLAGSNEGAIRSCWASGTLTGNGLAAIGGLVGVNAGVVFRSFANTQISGTNSKNGPGGLVGYNAGVVELSFSGGTVISSLSSSAGGGLIGVNEAGDGRIANAYTVSAVRVRKQSCCAYGGLVGQNGKGATVVNAYASGKIRKARNDESVLGGAVGDDESPPGSMANVYWDLDKGVSDPGQGAGNVRNDPGITGLTTQQLQSGLPPGFDPKIWGIDPKINDGLPYLLAVLPK